MKSILAKLVMNKDKLLNTLTFYDSKHIKLQTHQSLVGSTLFHKRKCSPDYKSLTEQVIIVQKSNCLRTLCWKLKLSLTLLVKLQNFASFYNIEIWWWKPSCLYTTEVRMCTTRWIQPDVSNCNSKMKNLVTIITCCNCAT